MLIRFVQILSCYRKTPKYIITPQLQTQNLPDLNPVDYSVWRVLKEKVYKIRVIDVNELKQRLRTECAKLHHFAIAAVVCQWRDSFRSVMRVLYTLSCNISHILLSN